MHWLTFLILWLAASIVLGLGIGIAKIWREKRRSHPGITFQEGLNRGYTTCPRCKGENAYCPDSLQRIGYALECPDCGYLKPYEFLELKAGGEGND